MELVLQVREGLRQRMMEVDWLDEDTRQLAIEKVTMSCNVLYKSTPNLTFSHVNFQLHAA